jgi:hypothetical protein
MRLLLSGLEFVYQDFRIINNTLIILQVLFVKYDLNKDSSIIKFKFLQSPAGSLNTKERGEFEQHATALEHAVTQQQNSNPNIIKIIN